MTRWMVWTALILKRVFLRDKLRKKAWYFGEQRNDEICNIKKKQNNASIINMYAVNLKA